MSEAWIIDACRTPRGIGKKGKGALADEHPQHLGAAVLKALQERNGFNTADVDDIIFAPARSEASKVVTWRVWRHWTQVMMCVPAVSPSIVSAVRVSPPLI